MSAFIVSKQHIDALVGVAIYGPKDGESEWRGISWARSCEPYQPYPEMCPDAWSELRWMKVAQGGLEQLRKSENEVTGDELGFILWAENVASVHYRYPGEDIDTLPGTYAEDGRHEVSHGYAFERVGFGAMPTTVEALKLISCLDYQSCEHDGWKDSEAFSILESLKDALIGQLAGYSAASWEWDGAKA